MLIPEKQETKTYATYLWEKWPLYSTSVIVVKDARPACFFCLMAAVLAELKSMLNSAGMLEVSEKLFLKKTIPPH